MTIAEIAQRAGVSKAAVSRYLNKGYISEEKKAMIQKVIEETGYVPSQQAQTLRTGKSKMIGVIVPRINSASISRIVAGISGILEQNGYRLLLANTDNCLEKELEYLEIFKNGNVDGVIFVATMVTPAHKRAIKASSVPIVIVGQQVAGLTCIYHDDRGAAYTMTKLLIDSGRHNIGYIGVTPRDKAAGAERRIGFDEAIKENGINLSEKYIEQSDFSVEAGYKAVKKIFERCPELNGLFCATDSIAIGAMDFLHDKNVSIPNDIAVVGIGDSSFSSLVTPKLTTAHYYYQTSGEEAAKHILEILQKGIDRKKQLKLGFEVCFRQSVCNLK